MPFGFIGVLLRMCESLLPGIPEMVRLCSTLPALPQVCFSNAQRIKAFYVITNMLQPSECLVEGGYPCCRSFQGVGSHTLLRI
eukprot:646118-Amphidinium_carterae.2